MANFFDQYDENQESAATRPHTGNFFDQFDEAVELPPRESFKTSTQNVERTWGDVAMDGLQAVDSGMRAVANAATFGWADEMAGAAGAATGIGGEFGEYDKNVNGQRAEDEKRWEEDPIMSGVGTVAGSVLIPGGAAAKGATMGAKAARAVGTGMAGGALGGAGNAEDMASVPEAMLEGGIIGGATGGLGGAALNAGGRVASGMGNFAGNRINNLASSRFGNGLLGTTGEALDGSFNTAVNKVEQYSPKLAGMADNVWDSIGGGKGAAARAGSLAVDGGTTVATEAGAKIGGAAAQGLGNSVMNNAGRIGNIAGQNVVSDPGAEAMRDPKTVLDMTSGTKYEYPLLEAANRGRDSLVAQVHILSQSDPEFRRLFGK